MDCSEDKSVECWLRLAENLLVSRMLYFDTVRVSMKLVDETSGRSKGWWVVIDSRHVHFVSSVWKLLKASKKVASFERSIVL